MTDGRDERPDIYKTSINSEQASSNISFAITRWSGLAPQCFLYQKRLPSIDKKRNYVDIIFAFYLLSFSGFCLNVALLVR